MGLLNVLDKFENFVGVNFWTMIFAWINLLILYLFLKKLLFKPLKNMIDSRQKEIDGMYSDAESAASSAEAMCRLRGKPGHRYGSRCPGTFEAGVRHRLSADRHPPGAGSANLVNY